MEGDDELLSTVDFARRAHMGQSPRAHRPQGEDVNHRDGTRAGWSKGQAPEVDRARGAALQRRSSRKPRWPTCAGDRRVESRLDARLPTVVPVLARARAKTWAVVPARSAPRRGVDTGSLHLWCTTDDMCRSAVDGRAASRGRHPHVTTTTGLRQRRRPHATGRDVRTGGRPRRRAR